MPIKAPYTEKVRGGRRPVTYRDSFGHTSSALIVGRGANAGQQQTVTVPNTVTAGTYTLTFSGQTTAPIAYNATAAQVQAAINALSNATPSASSGGPGAVAPIVITFSTGNGNAAVMTANSTDLTGGIVTVTINRSYSPNMLRLQLETHHNAADAIKDNVNLATGLKQTNVYFNR